MKLSSNFRLVGMAVAAALVTFAGAAAWPQQGAQTPAPNPVKQAAVKQIAITDASFSCIRDLKSVRGYYVGNLLGDVDATLAVANSANGGVYPPGSVVQLVPGEAMVKHGPGFNAATNDWEFFELDVQPTGPRSTCAASPRR